MIRNADLVERHFGYWPEFCDAKIKQISFDARGVLSLALDYVDVERGKRGRVSLVFSGVTDLLLTEMRNENVIDVLDISESPPYTVEIDACYGVGGTFKCTAIEVCGLDP